MVFRQGGQKDNQVQLIRLPDWTPMLESKGFSGMINHWQEVVAEGRLAEDVIA